MKSSKGVVFKRQQRILHLLQENTEMSVEDLSKELEVSEITIRRDLQQFEDQGVIERFYGGARYLAGKIKHENVEQIQYNSMKKKHRKKSRGISTRS